MDGGGRGADRRTAAGGQTEGGGANGRTWGKRKADGWTKDEWAADGRKGA